MNLYKKLSELGLLRQQVHLGCYTSFKIGGTCDYFFTASSFLSLQEALVEMKRARIPFYILGGGSNLLVTSKHLSGLVLVLSSYGVSHDPVYKEFTVIGSGIWQNKDEKNQWYVEAWVRMPYLLGLLQQHDRSGLSFAAGIPAQVGGSIRNNLTSFGESIFDSIKKVLVVDCTSGEKTWLDREDF